MKKLLKTICLFLPVISLTACGSYGNEIDKVEANNIYKAAVDAYPDVYTNQLTSTTSSYQSKPAAWEPFFGTGHRLSAFFLLYSFPYNVQTIYLPA